jgi:cytochrome c oxidase subunit II
MQIPGAGKPGIGGVLQLLATYVFLATASFAQTSAEPSSSTSIFSPASTPAHTIFRFNLFVLAITAAIFGTVFGLLVYAAVRFRMRANDDGREPPQVYGSDEIELAWTVLPVLIVFVMFLTAARIIHQIQDARRPPGGIEVTVVGHQFWWEFRYPQYGFVTANELHVPVSDPKHPTPTFLKLLSADTDHSFWVPRLAGKTALIPNHPNHTWIDPHQTGVYFGQCSLYCGTAHAKMLLRVVVQPRPDFDRWVRAQQQADPADVPMSTLVAEGRRVFLTAACINCHTVRGTVADGRFGPDLTHLMSRDTIASGAALNTPKNLRLWIQHPDAIKPGCLMPAMNLSGQQFDALAAYLLTLH